MMVCGGCLKVYNGLPQVALEGIVFKIANKEFKGTELNICYECAILALSGKGKKYKRKGNVVYVNYVN
jgi:hypothetical protein